MRYEEGTPEGEIQQEVDRLLLARYAPPSVVIDAHMEILSVRGHTSPYLEPAPGKMSFNLFKMAREGLGLELRTALARAKKSDRPVRKVGIQLHDRGILREISFEIIPLQASSTTRSFLILFTDTSVMPLSLLAHGAEQTSRAKPGTKDRRIQQLEDELTSRGEDMRFIIEEMEGANEELQSANEEILSSNEELQTLNEELETSKEEIQSTNEELLVVNQKLQQRNAQVQTARAHAEAIVETIREPLLILDREMRVQSANSAFYAFFQVTPQETEQQILFQLGNGQWNIPLLRTLLEEMLSHKHNLMDHEVEHLFPHIGLKIIRLNARRMEDDQLVLLALEDITERKHLEQAQQHLMEQREGFLGIASHELKTPVTSMKIYTQTLQRRFQKTGDEQAASFLGKVDEQLNVLIWLISELLDLTKIEAGQLPMYQEQFDLLTLVQDTVETIHHTTTRHQIHIEGNAISPVVADRGRIGQVLTNLLSNALKYSPLADIVLVKLYQEEHGTTIGVQDFGIGIEPAEQVHLFERFFRVSDEQHITFPGLGLGLYISAQIVQRQGGQIWVDSAVGKGSTFFFTIPHPPLATPTHSKSHP
ncbi:MAG TPA: ATP-binding protein [Ktedonobacteraceae bacterium]